MDTKTREISNSDDVIDSHDGTFRHDRGIRRGGKGRTGFGLLVSFRRSLVFLCWELTTRLGKE
jgi:hypothetical protein